MNWCTKINVQSCTLNRRMHALPRNVFKFSLNKKIYIKIKKKTEWLIIWGTGEGEERCERRKLDVCPDVSVHTVWTYMCVLSVSWCQCSCACKITCNSSSRQKREPCPNVAPKSTTNTSWCIPAFTIWFWGAAMHQVAPLTALQCVSRPWESPA